jgi:NAD(P) transhydrogenase subunit beta
MSNEVTLLAYLVAAVLFILGLKRLGSPATARGGNRLASIGMLVAVIVALLDQGILDYVWVAVGLVLGAAIGAFLARRVEMTGMPELVAVFNGLGGGASALVAASSFLGEQPDELVTLLTLALSVLVGAITFTGSLVAYGKLAGRIPGRPVGFPGQLVIDGILGVVAIGAVAWFTATGEPVALWVLAGVALILGLTRVLPIGGGDMPVVIAFLNSMSGIAASMAGFALESAVLIIAGALVGASGLILTMIMVRAMNRTLVGVLAGGFGDGDGGGTGPIGEQPVRRGSAEDLGVVLAYAESVVVVPGYGLAVAQAQHALRDLANELAGRGVRVRYAIHPVAGRMPGHMNVLLAEADVPYDQLFDLDDINDDLPNTDVALVVGANDVVNPAAREDAASPIYGMPILDVDYATTTIVIKRSLSPGFAGIDNPLFYEDGTYMLFADAKAALDDLAREVKEA